MNQTIALGTSRRESLQEMIKHHIDCGLSPDTSISDVMLDQRNIDPLLLRIGELQWVVYLHDPEIDAMTIMNLDKSELTARYKIIRQKHQSGGLPMRSIFSLGGDHFLVPLKEIDIAERTIERLVGDNHIARRDVGGGAHISERKVVAWAGH
jgi:hypothetical protein